MSRRIWLMLAVTLAAQSVDAQAPVIRDSAGVQIVENAARRSAPTAFQVAARPLMELFGDPTRVDSAFYTHHNAPVVTVHLRDGRIAVANGVQPGMNTSDTKFVVRITFFSAEGVFLNHVIIDGGFQSIWEMCQGRGDTLIIADVNTKRVGVLDGKGALVHVIPIKGGTPPQMCFADGTIRISRDSRSGRDGLEQHTVSVRTDGSLVTDFGWIPVTSNRGLNSFPVGGNSLYLADRQNNEYRVYSASGTLERIVRTSDRPEAVTAEQIRNGEVRAPITGRQITPGTPTYDVWPSYGRAKVDPQGRLWVADHERDGTVSRFWTAFDASGKLVGRVEIPAAPLREAWTVDAFDGDRVLIQIVDHVTGKVRLAYYALAPVTPARPAIPSYEGWGSRK